MHTRGYYNGTDGRSAASLHTWAGSLVGQLTKAAAGTSGKLYAASDAKVTLEAWSDASAHEDSDVTAPSGSSTKNTAFAALEPAGSLKKEKMAASQFADTLNANLQEVYKSLRDLGLESTIQLKNI